MNRGNRKFTTAHLAIATAMLCGTTTVFAQEIEATPVVVAPPPIVQSVPAPAPVASPTVAPPPMVPTVSAEPAQAEPPAARRTAAPKATARATQRARTVPTATATRAAPATATAPTVVNEPTIDGTSVAPTQEPLPVAPVNEAPVEEAPVDQTVTPVADGSEDDWMIYGGLAAALGLAGLGGALASRRRKTRSRDAVALEPRRVAPAPVRNMPAPMPIAAKPMPVSTFAPVASHDAVSVAAPVTAPIRRPSFADQHLPPVTDPLFKHQPVLAPVTDPLFMHKTELAPVTDPMFADKAEFAGAPTNGSVFDKRRDWPNGEGGARPPLRETEPAE